MIIKDKIMNLDKNNFIISKAIEFGVPTYNSNNVLIGEVLGKFILTLNIYKKNKNIKINSIKIDYVNECKCLDMISLKELINNILNTDIEDKNINILIY